MTKHSLFIGQVVRLKKMFELISECGHYGEPGMLVRIKDIQQRTDRSGDYFCDITADFGEFLEHNRAYESSDFLVTGEDGKERSVNGHESGDYKPIDNFVVDPEYFNDYMELSEDGPLKDIREAFVAQVGDSGNFQEFLIAKLAAAMEAGFDLSEAPVPSK